MEMIFFLNDKKVTFEMRNPFLFKNNQDQMIREPLKCYFWFSVMN